MPEDHTTNATVAREHRFRGTDAAGRDRRTTGLDDGAIDGARVAPILRRRGGCTPLDPASQRRATRLLQPSRGFGEVSQGSAESLDLREHLSSSI